MKSLLILSFHLLPLLCPLTPAFLLSPNNLIRPQPLNLTNNFANLTVGGNAHCTQDSSWLIAPYENITRYRLSCQNAMAQAIRELSDHGMDTEFEFLDRGATAQTSKPRIELPRKYIYSEYLHLDLHPRTFSPKPFLRSHPSKRNSWWAEN